MSILDAIRGAPTRYGRPADIVPHEPTSFSSPLRRLRRPWARRAIFSAIGTLCLLPATGLGLARSTSAYPVIGMYRIVPVERGETLLKIARRYSVNVRVLAALNQVRNGALRSGQELTLPLLHAMPLVPDEGIVLNVPERQVYVMRGAACVATFPVAVGKPDWPTARGTYTVSSMVVNPEWQPTKSMIERTQIRDEPVPPGPDNPLGDRWIGWSLKGFGFHSTSAPGSIGSAASHGCVRLFPEDAHKLFELVKKGDTIYSVYEPVVVAKRRGRCYLCVFPDIYHQAGDPLERAKSLLRKELPPGSVDMEEVAEIVRNHDGYPIPLGIAKWSRSHRASGPAPKRSHAAAKKRKSRP